MSKQGLGLRAEHKGTPLHRVKQQLDPQLVPVEKQRVLPPVPDGKDPIELLGHLHAVLHVSA